MILLLLLRFRRAQSLRRGLRHEVFAGILGINEQSNENTRTETSVYLTLLSPEILFSSCSLDLIILDSYIIHNQFLNGFENRCLQS